MFHLILPPMLRCLFPLLLIAATSSAQTIDENTKDEFTGARIVSTNWEWLSYSGETATIYFKIRVVNDDYYLHLKYMLTWGGVFAIGNRDQFMLKLANDSVVKLTPSEGQVSCKGCGSVGMVGYNYWGTHTNYPLSPEAMEALMSSPIVKTRLYTSDGFLEQEVNPKRQDYVLKALKLFHGRR
jgi:hypothetical protein